MASTLQDEAAVRRPDDERSAPKDDALGVLIEQARNGSRAAMGQLVTLCRSYLLKIANRELPRRRVMANHESEADR